MSINGGGGAGSSFWVPHFDNEDDSARSSQIIEGISNQVLAFVFTSFVGVLSLCTLVYKFFARSINPNIHPDSLEHVRMTRNSRNGGGAPDQSSRSGNSEFGNNLDGFQTAGGVDQSLPRQGAFGRLSEESCPICLVPFRIQPQHSNSASNGSVNAVIPPLPVETNCGHLFCAECLMRFHEVSTVMSALTCPVCRQMVTLLIWDRSLPSSSLTSEQRQQIDSIQMYNRRYSGQPRPIPMPEILPAIPPEIQPAIPPEMLPAIPPELMGTIAILTLIDIVRDVPTLIRHFIRNIFSVGGIRVLFRFRSLVFITTCLLYIVLPLDLIPEALFGILGLLDDVFIILCAVTWLSIQYRNFLLENN